MLLVVQLGDVRNSKGVITGVMKHLGLGEPWRSNIHRDNIGGLIIWEI